VLSLSQVTAGTVAAFFGVLSPGGAVTFQPPPSGGTAVAIGLSTTVTLTNGFLLPPGGVPVSWALPETSQPSSLYAVAGTAQAFCVAFVNGS
jgi:hypothetical protein